MSDEIDTSNISASRMYSIYAEIANGVPIEKSHFAKTVDEIAWRNELAAEMEEMKKLPHFKGWDIPSEWPDA